MKNMINIIFHSAPLESGMEPSENSGNFVSAECPKIYRKSVLHLLKYTANLYSNICSTVCGIFWDTQYKKYIVITVIAWA